MTNNTPSGEVPYTLHQATLSNGLRVVGLRAPHLRSLVISAFVGVGARHEHEDDKGISHFLEHMMLSGTETYPSMSELFGAVERMGGMLNGASMFDHTIYWMRLHRDHVADGLHVMADILTRPLLDPDAIAAERNTILNEMAGISGESALELMLEMMWPGRSGEFNVPGSLETAEAFNRERLLAHYRRFYVPGNMVLCVVGCFDVEATFRLIDATLGQMAGDPAPGLVALGPAQPGPQWNSRPAGGTQASFWLAHRAYTDTDPRRTVLYVLNTMLGWGTRSLLFEKVREEAGLAYYIESDTLLNGEYGLFNIQCELPVENLMDAMALVFDVVRRLTDAPIEADRLERAIELMRCQIEFQLDNPETLARIYGLGALLGRAFDPPLELARKVRAVTAEQVTEVAREVFRPDRRYLLLYGPEGQMVRRRQIERLLAVEPA
ncbi:MAG: pitrilysin family protein [Anaerolineae bacterium]